MNSQTHLQKEKETCQTEADKLNNAQENTPVGKEFYYY